MGDRSTLTFTLSEAANDVTSDVTISGGSLSNWTVVSRSVYSATFTPESGSTMNGVISVASGVFTDSAGNTNSDGSDYDNYVIFTIDTTTPDPDPLPVLDQTSDKSTNRPDLILDINNIGSANGEANFRIKPRSKTCQTIFNINNQATGNDNEESGEKLIYKIVEGNIKRLFNISDSGVLSFLPRRGAFIKERQIVPLTISISSSKRPEPTPIQPEIVLPAKVPIKRKCDPVIFETGEEGYQLIGNRCNDTIRGRYSFTALHGRKGNDQLVGYGQTILLMEDKANTIRAGPVKIYSME